MGQLWAQLAADFYRVEGISCYSGGTEVTAFNPRAVQALESAGFSVSRQDESQNPVYLVKFPGADLGISSFSKKYSDPPNPTEHFIAVMTCSDADEACPIVYGASARHTITYEDPKRFDSTPEEKAKYNERCGQIATEMLYLFSRI
jgi:arsenate reductase